MRACHLWLGSLVWTLGACQSGAAIGTPCERASDCSSPLVCRIGHCRTECVVGRDCPAGQACLLNADGLGACELPAVDVCSASCDAPLVCASGHCRVGCTMEMDCPGGHLCVGGACQRADVATDGGLDDVGVLDAARGAHDAGHPLASDGALSDHGDGGLFCDPVSNTGCASGARCGLSVGTPACVADTGTLVLGDECGAEEALCGVGYSCQGGRCVQVCFLPDDGFCGTDRVCSIDSVHGQSFLDSTNGIGLCTESCDPFFDAGCPAGASCAFGVGSRGDYTWCRDVGVVDEGGACTNAYECAAGLDCYMHACRQFCLLASGAGCAADRHCVGGTNFHDRPQLGACVP